MANSDYEQRGSGQFTAIGNAANSLDYFSDIIEVVEMVFDSTLEDDISVGMGIMIEEEVLRLVEIIDYNDVHQTLTIRVARGCADTRPWQHPGGVDVWFFSETIGTDGRIYAGGEQNGVKVLPWTHSGGTMAVEKSPPQPITFNWRFSRPYLPGHMRHSASELAWFNNAKFGYDDGGLLLRWTHRDRVLQADQLIDHFQGNIGPEPGSVYKARIYNAGNDLLRTEVGISGTQWLYPWAQAMGDFGLLVGSNAERQGFLEFMSYRDGLDSWQYYRIPFTIVADGPQALIAMYGEQVLLKPVPGEDDERQPIMRGANVAMFGQQVMQPSDNSGPGDGGLAVGAMVALLQEDVTSGDSVFAPLNRIWFEAPYTYLIRRYNMAPFSPRIVSGVARTSDRLTDSHSIWSKLRDEVGGDFVKKGEPPWCAWATLGAPLNYLDSTAKIDKTSLADGVPLDGVHPGMLALVGGEIVIVRSVDQVAGTIALGRGSVDTVPARHSAGARIWFFEAACGVDEGPFPDPVDNDDRVSVDLKAVPRGYGGYEVAPRKVPSDLLKLSLRKQRPFPPGRLLVNGQPWFEGFNTEPNRSLVFTFTQRNRLTLRANAVDHHYENVADEPGTTYVFTIATYRITTDNRTVPLIIRQDRVVGQRYEYTWEMALQDGFRIAAIHGYCGRLTATITVDAERDGLLNWQGYGVRVTLPAPACPPGQSPGGNTPRPPGGGPGGGANPGGNPGGGNGNGSNNDSPGEGGNDRPPREEDPFDNGGGDNGDTGYPGDKEPPGEGEEGAMYWDTKWDIFYAARKRGEDDIGE